MAEIADILTTLVERSREDKISWRTSADESTFVAVLGKASVSIEEDYSQAMTLRILNQEGREIESMSRSVRSDQALLEELAQLQELYAMARRAALGVGSQLDELLKELQAGA